MIYPFLYQIPQTQLTCDMKIWLNQLQLENRALKNSSRTQNKVVQSLHKESYQGNWKFWMTWGVLIRHLKVISAITIIIVMQERLCLLN